MFSKVNLKQLFLITALVAMPVTRSISQPNEQSYKEESSTHPRSIAQTSEKPLTSKQFMAGDYTDNKGTTCTLDTSDLMNGRKEVALSCLDKSNQPILSATWATGMISEHPFELDLKRSGIDKISGYANYSWGKVGSSSNWPWNCFNPNNIISARQIGKTLSLTNYRDSGNIAVCGVNLKKK